MGAQDRLYQQFADRFEADGDGYIFRNNLQAAGMRTTTAERDQFVVEYKRSLRWLTWGSAALILPPLLGVLVAASMMGINLPSWIGFLVSAPVLAAFVISSRWIWNAPVRALRGRLPVTQERSKEDARRLAFRRMTLGQLGSAVLLEAIVFWRLAATHNLLAGWNWLWLAAAVAFLVLIAVQAVRKWRAG